MTDWEKTSFPQIEKEVLAKWLAIRPIEYLNKRNISRPILRSQDGWPFSNGKPHYGHIVVSFVKDTMIRYFTMQGFRVDRNTGYDSHGMPSEQEARKIIKYQTKEELLAYGIEKHNQLCRDLTQSCISHWKTVFDRIGRWVDPALVHSTMDLTVMENTMKTFQKLYQQGLIYEGYKCLPYSTGCQSTMSQFEAKMNYKQVTDTAITVKFQLVDNPFGVDHLYVLAWTTTPYSLPSNLALCTEENLSLVLICDQKTKEHYILGSKKFESFRKQTLGKELRYLVIKSLLGGQLRDLSYVRPFNSVPGKILMDTYIKEDMGTGISHLAPNMGEDDYRICLQHGLIKVDSKENIIDIIDDNGFFTALYPGVYFKEAGELIVSELEKRSLLFDKKMHTHNYPYCYRTDTPLLYRLANAYFMKTSSDDFRQRMMANNAQINWNPSTVGSHQFAEWLKGTRDWCISRERYFGVGLPLWKSDDGEVLCLGSIAELEKFSGQKITDLHIEFLDKLEITSNGKSYQRVSGVLDCWFESSSCIYVYGDQEIDFVSESHDQVRGFFYALNVMEELLHSRAAFKNVIVTGLILAADGAKMAKSKQNYPDPMLVLDKLGADSLRLYLLSTPVLKAESVKFNEEAIAKIQQKTLTKVYNIYLFLEDKIKFHNTKAAALQFPSGGAAPSNVLDRYMINKTHLFLKEVSAEMNAYHLSEVLPKILSFIDILTNFYLKLARERLKACDPEGLQTLWFVFYAFLRMAAPFMPFLSDFIYTKFDFPNKLESIHYLEYPQEAEFPPYDPRLEEKFNLLMQTIGLIREMRSDLLLNNCRPLKKVSLGCSDEEYLNLQELIPCLQMETNTLAVERIAFQELVEVKVSPNLRELSIYLKDQGQMKLMEALKKEIPNLQPGDLYQGLVLPEHLFIVSYLLKDQRKTVKVQQRLVVSVDDVYDAVVEREHYARLIHKAIQKYRKVKKMKVWDLVALSFFSPCLKISSFVEDNKILFLGGNISSLTRVSSIQELGINVFEYPLLESSLFLGS